MNNIKNYYELFDSQSESELLEEFEVIENQSTLDATDIGFVDDEYYYALKTYLEDKGFVGFGKINMLYRNYEFLYNIKPLK